MIRIGYKASAEQFGPRQLADFTVTAERLGFDSATISDHYQPWRHHGGHSPNSIVWLSHAGARTERILLGTSVLTPTFRYHPAVIAQMWATLGCLYPGRIMLGVGTGEALNEIALGQQRWPGFAERFARLRESVRLIRRLWTEDRVTFEGEFYQTSGAMIYDRPDQPIPIYVAAGGPTMATYAGRQGDGLLCTSGKGASLYRDELMPALAKGAARNSRDLDAIDTMIEIKLSYDPDPDRAVENCRFWAPLSLSKEQKHDISDPEEMERAADALPLDQVAARWIIASTPEQAVDQIRFYTELGFTHLVFHAPGHDQDRFLHSFAGVLPHIRALG